MLQQRGIYRAIRCLGVAVGIGVFSLQTAAAAYSDAGSEAAPGTWTRVQAAPNLFGTVTAPIPAHRFARQWARAQLDATRHPALQRLVEPGRGLGKVAQIAFVQGAVHRNIRWISDATEWGIHDYWASAAETLDRGAGDMEDRAIVKMQALLALGFDPADLYLTLGRDKVGGPITVLIASVGGRHYVLDDLGGEPVATERRAGFAPVLSFGRDQTWVHASRRAPATGAQVAAAPQ